MTCMSHLKPVLPHDVLRLIFEQAALEDRRTALRLALVSRFSQRWMELILYSVVILHRETTCRAFLRTVETSRTKSQSFFATHVKSLCISYDIHTSHTVRIISVCRGVTSLTFWVIPTTMRTSTIPSPHREIAAALESLRPKRLSILLHGVLGSPYPHFHLSFFRKITHLSVINKWEDWTAWWGFDLMPCLTHLSFDLHVGPMPLDEGAVLLIAQALHTILLRCAYLRVCVILLIFDPSPGHTATTILNIIPASDPRLVFMNDSEPFLDREAHSIRETRVWKMAEQVVSVQSLGPVFRGFTGEYISIRLSLFATGLCLNIFRYHRGEWLHPDVGLGATEDASPQENWKHDHI